MYSKPLEVASRVLNTLQCFRLTTDAWRDVTANHPFINGAAAGSNSRGGGSEAATRYQSTAIISHRRRVPIIKALAAASPLLPHPPLPSPPLSQRQCCRASATNWLNFAAERNLPSQTPCNHGANSPCGALPEEPTHPPPVTASATKMEGPMAATWWIWRLRHHRPREQGCPHRRRPTRRIGARVGA